MWEETIDTLEDCFLKAFPNFLHATTITARDTNLPLWSLVDL